MDLSIQMLPMLTRHKNCSELLNASLLLLESITQMASVADPFPVAHFEVCEDVEMKVPQLWLYASLRGYASKQAQPC